MRQSESKTYRSKKNSFRSLEVSITERIIKPENYDFKSQLKLGKLKWN